MGLDRGTGNPILLMNDRGDRAHVSIMFNRGQAYIELKNADGSELTVSPSQAPRGWLLRAFVGGPSGGIGK
jgi:hypothetical protein